MTTLRGPGPRVVVLGVLTTIATACGPPSSMAPAGIKPVPSVDQAISPAGWMPVVYGKAQVSVPGGSRITFGGCPVTSVTVFLGHGPEQLFCPAETGEHTTAYLEPIQPPFLQRSREKPIAVNGIDTLPEFGSPSTGGYQVPSLGVQVIATGTLARKILSTLTYSPRAVALATGPVPRLSSSWHRVSFGGISVAVPRSWRIKRQQAWGTCLPDGINVFTHEVFLDAGSSESAFQCPYITPGSVGQPAIDGVTIDPGTYGPLADVGRYANCEDVHGLRVCPSATEDGRLTLVMAVHLVGRASPIAVEIGTSGNGMMARAILWSLLAS